MATKITTIRGTFLLSSNSEITSRGSNDRSTIKFRQNNDKSEIALILLSENAKISALEYLNYHYELSGFFVNEDSLKNDAAFVALNISKLESIDLVIKSKCALLDGVVVAISGVLMLKAGAAVFINIYSGGEEVEGKNVLIMMHGGAVNAATLISVGDFLKFSKLKKLVWDKNECNNYDNFQSFLVSSSNLIVSHIPKRELKPNSDPPNIKCFLEQEQYMEPKSVMQRDLYLSCEVDINCNILSWNPYGSFQIAVLLQSKGDARLQLYVPHSSFAKSVVLFSTDVDIVVYNVLPIYMWNRLRGFAFTTRSSISIKHVKDPDSSNQFTRGALSYVPPEIRESCHIYCAFRVDLDRRLKDAVGNFSAFSKQTKNALILTVEMMPSIALSYLERCNENDPDSKVTACSFQSHLLLNSTSFPPDFRSPLRYHCWLNKPTLSNSSTTKYSIQNEFSSAWHASFYAVRNCSDTDWLCNKLPYVVNVTAILKNLESIIHMKIRREGLSALKKFTPHLIDLFAKVETSDLSSSSKVSEALVVVGNVLQCKWLNVDLDSKSTCLLTIADSKGEHLPLIVVDCLAPQVKSIQQLQIKSDMLPTVLLYRPICIIEDDPSNSKLFADITLLSSITRLKIVTHESEAIDFSFNKSNSCEVCGQKRKYTHDAEVNAVVDIRDLLSMSLDGCDKSKTVYNVRGIVISKSLSLNGYQPKCSMKLRDVRYGDTILCYMLVSEIEHIIVGMHIKINNCRLRMAKSKKKSLYLEDIFARNVKITGVVDFSKLAHLFNYVKRSGFSKLYVDSEVLTPPRISIDQLCKGSSINRQQSSSLSANLQYSSISKIVQKSAVEHRDDSFDRLSWTFTGHIVFVKQLGASLRCRSCFSTIANQHSRCLKGCASFGTSSSSSLSDITKFLVVWELIVTFDDGTGECVVHFEETDDVMQFLKSVSYPTAAHTAMLLMDKIVQWLLIYGSFNSCAQNSMKKYSSTSSLGASHSDNLNDNFACSFLEDDESMSYKVLSGMNVSERMAKHLAADEVHEAMSLHLQCSSPSEYWQLTGLRDLAVQTAPSMAAIKLQEVNHYFPHKVNFASIHVRKSESLQVEGCQLMPLKASSSSLQRAAWNMLAEL